MEAASLEDGKCTTLNEVLGRAFCQNYQSIKGEDNVEVDKNLLKKQYATLTVNSCLNASNESCVYLTYCGLF